MNFLLIFLQEKKKPVQNKSEVKPEPKKVPAAAPAKSAPPKAAEPAKPPVKKKEEPPKPSVKDQSANKTSKKEMEEKKPENDENFEVQRWENFQIIVEIGIISYILTK